MCGLDCKQLHTCDYTILLGDKLWRWMNLIRLRKRGETSDVLWSVTYVHHTSFIHPFNHVYEVPFDLIQHVFTKILTKISIFKTV